MLMAEQGEEGTASLSLGALRGVKCLKVPHRRIPYMIRA